MAENFNFDCKGHNSIYIENYCENNYNNRKFNVCFSAPNHGVNSETGILLFIPGFYANTNSNIYKKMRQNFADKYNLVTIQCDYFGSEFMQDSVPLKLTQVSIDLLNKYDLFINGGTIIDSDKLQTVKENINLTATANLNESLENFNDLCYMQALDNITAVLNVFDILYNNNYSFNTNKVIIMEQSQGAYLGYLCNIMCRGLFTHILDNSAWPYPYYLKSSRTIGSKLSDKVSISADISYFSKNMNFKTEYLELNNLYKNIENLCSIVSYHGTNDELVNLDDKIDAISKINNVTLNIISDINLKEGIFTNTAHGLGADFNKLFDSFYKKYVNNIKPNSMLNFKNNVILNGSNLEIDYSTGLPIVTKFNNLL